jgi:hypothetical protein
MCGTNVAWQHWEVRQPSVGSNEASYAFPAVCAFLVSTKEGKTIQTNNTKAHYILPTSTPHRVYESCQWKRLNREGKRPLETGNDSVTEAITAVKSKGN